MERMSDQLLFKCTPALRSALEEVAYHDRTSLSDTIRSAVREYLEHRQ